ncbi:MAG: hypothetical protein KA264_01085 [Crocinitomicaceae bacterium]|nr:hypothetical protein [Crocinitomicaceae bacterium]
MFKKVYIVLIIFYANSFLSAQSLRNKKPLLLDDLIIEANHISKSNIQYLKSDSLINEIELLKNKILEKDSIIDWLKKNNQIVFKNSEKLEEKGSFIIIGAFNIKENALALLNNHSKYPVSIFRFQHSKFNYVGYKMNPNQNLIDVLIYFRKYIKKDAWILKVSTN